MSLGEVAEWSIAAVLKTVELRGSGGSNPSLSARLQCRTDDLGHPFCFLCRYVCEQAHANSTKTIPPVGVFCIVLHQRARHCLLSVGVEPIEGCLLLDFVCANLYRLYGIAVRTSSLSARPQCRTDDLGHPFCFLCIYVCEQAHANSTKTIPPVGVFCIVLH